MYPKEIRSLIHSISPAAPGRAPGYHCTHIRTQTGSLVSVCKGFVGPHRDSRQVAGFAALGQDRALLEHSSRGAAFGYQVAAVVVTVAIAAAGGALAGFLVTAFDPADQKLTSAQLFDDGTFWVV